MSKFIMLLLLAN